MAKRVKTRPKVQSEVLIAVRRRCALWFGLDGDLGRKDGQIAHIDRDASNGSQSNLAWLCLTHHSEYDSTSRQHKSLTPDELRRYKSELIKQLKSESVQLSSALAPQTKHSSSRAGDGRISLELYDRRILIYHACRDYLNAVLREANVSPEILSKLSAATDEAMFLFDEAMATYVRDLLLKGIALRRERMRAERGYGKADPDTLWAEYEAALDALVKASEQIHSTFKPYFRL